MKFDTGFFPLPYYNVHLKNLGLSSNDFIRSKGVNDIKGVLIVENEKKIISLAVYNHVSRFLEDITSYNHQANLFLVSYLMKTIMESKVIKNPLLVSYKKNQFLIDDLGFKEFPNDFNPKKNPYRRFGDFSDFIYYDLRHGNLIPNPEKYKSQIQTLDRKLNNF